MLTIFARVTAGILPEILAGSPGSDKSQLQDACSELLKAAGSSLQAADFCHLYLNLRERTLSAEAGFLIKKAEMNPEAPEIIKKMKSYGLCREARQLAAATRHKNG